MSDQILDTLSARIREALSILDREGKDATLSAVLLGTHPADIVEAMHDLSHPDSLALFNWLDNERAAYVLSEMESERTRYFLDNAPPRRVAELLARLPMDDAAWVVSEATPERAETLLSDLTTRAPEEAAEVRELLAYKPGTAGRLMIDNFVRLSAEMTVDEAFAAVRRADPEVETLNDLYVVENGSTPQERLIGVVSLRELVRASSKQTIAEIMTRDLITVTVDTDQEEVARLINKYNFLAMPVLTRSGTLVGIITADDIIDVLVAESTEDHLRFGAVEPGVVNQPYFSIPIWRVVRSRVGWLVLLFVAETATGTVLRHFEDELAKVVALTFFIPLLVGTGGNTGAQTVSTIIRGLALNEIKKRDLGRVLIREFGSGLLLGTLLGIIGFVRAHFWGSGDDLSLVVGLTILVIVTWANTIGSLIPLVAQRFKIDPALVSAPLITTLVDATGLVIYMLIAKALLTALN